MRGWLILSFTFAIGIVLGVGAMTKGPALVAPYLPKSISGQSERIDGEVVRKQREGNRLLVKVATAQGPMLVTFTQKVAELDLLLEPGDRVELITSAYATFVEDPTLERVKRPAGTGGTPSSPSTPAGSSQGSQEKTGR
jgi:TOBE domain